MVLELSCDRQTDRETDRHTYRQQGIHTDIQTEIHTDIKPSNIHRQTHRRTDIKTSYTYRHTYRGTYHQYTDRHKKHIHTHTAILIHTDRYTLLHTDTRHTNTNSDTHTFNGDVYNYVHNHESTRLSSVFLLIQLTIKISPTKCVRLFTKRQIIH